MTAPTAVTGLTCNGSAQTLVNAGSTTGGTLYYMLTTTNDRPSADAEGWMTDIPTGTHAGTYYVWTKVSGNENYNAVDVSATGVAGVALQQAQEGDMVGSDGKSYPATAQLPDGLFRYRSGISPSGIRRVRMRRWGSAASTRSS